MSLAVQISLTLILFCFVVVVTLRGIEGVRGSISAHAKSVGIFCIAAGIGAATFSALALIWDV